MSTLKSPGRQSSFEYFSPFNAVLSSVGAEHEKALKQAFYNTVALVFVIAGGAAGVAVYFVLGPFLKPLLWAGLCGAFLHPFKSTMTRIFRKWLESLRSSNTPLVVGAAVVPFQLLNNCSDVLGGFVARRLRLIVILTLLTPFMYGLYVFRPFLEIFSVLYHASVTLYIIMDYFSNPFAVWSIILGYSIALVVWWTPSSSQVMRILSFPVWMAFVIYLASIAGVYRVPLFLVIVALTVVGFITEATGGKDQVDGSNNTKEPNKRSSIIEGLSVAASVLSPLSYDTDDSSTSNIEDIPNISPAKTNLNETPQTAIPTDNIDGRETRLQRMRRQNKARFNIKKKSKPKSASYAYFIALLWGILLMRVWMHAWVLQLLPIPFAIFLIKMAVIWSGAWAYVQEVLFNWYERLRQWASQRQDAIVPAPIRGMAKLVMRGDQKVNSLMEKSIDNLMSVFMVIGLIVVSIIVTVLLAVQVHHESVHLVTVTGNLVNDVMAKNPQLLKWISENAEFKKTLDSAVERGYILGRQWIADKVGSFLGDSGNNTQLQQSVLEVTDRFYHAWMTLGNDSSIKAANGSIGWTKIKLTNNETTTELSWGNMFSWVTKLDFKILFSVVKENLGILMSLLESLYMIVKGNVTMVINLVTMVLSLVFFSGTYVLNTGLSMVVFVTAIFYLLSTSGDHYRPVEWFGKMSATGTAGFGESLFKAIRDVFGAALKMATFYGLYTWFTHTLFGINIVFIPSAIAAVTAVVPFVGTYWAALPGVLELWLVQKEEVLAIIFAICHILPISFVDTAIYSEISGGGHPYLTGLAVAGGIYCVGLEGAIIGPIVLCCLIVAVEVYGSMIAETSPTSAEATLMSDVEGNRVPNVKGLAGQFKKTPFQKPTPCRE